MVAHRSQRRCPLHRPQQLLRRSRHRSMDVACYNNPMSFPRSAWSRIVLFAIVIYALVWVALVFEWYYTKGGVNAYLALLAFLVAFGTLLVTIYNLILTRRDIKARIRPFVTIADIGPRPRPWNGFSLPLQNTGALPADELNILVSFINSKTGETEHPVPQEYLTLLAPGSQHTIYLYNLPPHFEKTTLDGNMQVQVLINYQCLGTNYETQQTYTIENPTIVATPASDASIFVFKPTSPSHCR